VRPPRDERLDLARGVALLCIYIDHVSQTWLHQLTPRAWQVCDFAEVFIFVSGYAAAMRYAPLLEEHGWLAGQRKALLRCWTLYRAYLAMFALTMLTVYICFQHGLRQPANILEAFLKSPPTYLLRAVYFSYCPTFFSIFPLYCMLVLAVPTLMVSVKRWPFATLAGSVCLYGLTHWLHRPQVFWRTTGEAWDFDPASWQLLFVAGMLATRFAWPRLINPRWMRRLALVAVSSIAVLCLLHLYGRYSPGAYKVHLGPARVVNFAAWLVLAQAWLGRVPRSRWLLACGRNSLLVFCLGSWLAVVTSLLISAFPAAWSQGLLPVGGVALLIALARFAPQKSVPRPPRVEPVRRPARLLLGENEE
jgi:hypothetical protein